MYIFADHFMKNKTAIRLSVSSCTAYALQMLNEQKYVGAASVQGCE